MPRGKKGVVVDDKDVEIEHLCVKYINDNPEFKQLNGKYASIAIDNILEDENLKLEKGAIIDVLTNFKGTMIPLKCEIVSGKKFKMKPQQEATFTIIDETPATNTTEQPKLSIENVLESLSSRLHAVANKLDTKEDSIKELVTYLKEQHRKPDVVEIEDDTLSVASVASQDSISSCAKSLRISTVTRKQKYFTRYLRKRLFEEFPNEPVETITYFEKKDLEKVNQIKEELARYTPENTTFDLAFGKAMRSLTSDKHKIKRLNKQKAIVNNNECKNATETNKSNDVKGVLKEQVNVDLNDTEYPPSQLKQYSLSQK